MRQDVADRRTVLAAPLHIPGHQTREQDGRLTLAGGRVLSYGLLGAEQGDVVVVLDGPGSRGMARAMSPFAAALGLRLLAPDRPGFGGSTSAPGRAITDWPHEHAALLDALGVQRAGVVGHSGGTPYALAAAAALPDRTPRVALLAPVAPVHGDRAARDELGTDLRRALAVAPRAPWLLRLALRAASRRVARNPEKAARRIIRESPPADAEVLRDPAIREMHVRTSGEILAHPDAVAAEIGLLAGPWGVSPRDVRAPVAMWSGAADRTHPTAHARRLATAIGGVPVHVVPEAATFGLRPRFEDVLRFAAAG